MISNEMLSPSMELRLMHIEAALDIAMRENNQEVIDAVRRNAKKMLDGNNRNVGVFQEVARRLEAMLERISR